MNGEQLKNIISGLKENNFLNYTHLLTGYIGNKFFLEKIKEIIDNLKEKNPSFQYGKFYY